MMTEFIFAALILSAAFVLQEIAFYETKRSAWITLRRSGIFMFCFCAIIPVYAVKYKFKKSADL